MLAAGLLGIAGSRGETPVDDDSASTSPEMKPLWEAGVFGGIARLPHYRGSDEYRVYVLPLPFLIYRGEVVQANRDGVRGVFYRGERVEMDLSFSGNPPVDSDNSAREGMPSLDPLIEAGPAVKYYFTRWRADPSLYLQAAVRGVCSVGMSTLGGSYEGIRGGLNLILSDYRPNPGGSWRFGLNGGVDFTDSGFNAFFYNVTEEQARSDRETYDSGGGYAGFSLSGYALKKFNPRFSWGFYARWDNISGAVYEDSPLVRERNNVVFGTALIWTIQQSKRFVHARE